jgi:site-specific recombinase XerD
MNDQISINHIVSKLSNLANQSNVLGANNDIDAIAIWLREYKDNVNTTTSYRQCVERYYLWVYYRGKQLNTITREDLQDYQDFLADPQPKEMWCGKRMPKGPDWKPFVSGLGVSSIRLQFWILKNLYNYLVAADYLAKNPFLLIKKMPKPINKGVDRVLAKKHIDYILEYIDQMPVETYPQEFDKEQANWFIRLLFLSGMRISEVTSGKMSDFIFQREQWWIRTIGKGDKYGEIPATEDLIDALARYRKFIGLTSLPQPFEEYPLIIRRRGAEIMPLTANMIHRIFKKILTATADYIEQQDPSAAYLFRKSSVHWLRHSCATHQVESGIDVVTVKENLRHSNIDTTMRYVHKDKTSRHKETSKKFKI